MAAKKIAKKPMSKSQFQKELEDLAKSPEILRRGDVAAMAHELFPKLVEQFKFKQMSGNPIAPTDAVKLGSEAWMLAEAFVMSKPAPKEEGSLRSRGPCLWCTSPVPENRTDQFCSDECQEAHDRKSYEEG